MSEEVKPPTMFWVAGILFLLWNAFGCFIYYIDKATPDAKYTEMYGEAMTALRDAYPVWATAGYAIGVWGGLLAAILFLLRKRQALPVFVASLIGAIVSFLWVFITPEAQAAMGSTFWVMPVIVVVIGVFEIWVTKRKIAKGILG